MPVSFAGIGLTPPDGQSAALDWWHGYRIEEFDFPFFNASQLDYLPVPPEPRKDPPRLGVLRWPTGASRFASCNLIATAAQLIEIRAQYALDVDTGASIPSAQTLVIGDGTNAISTEMWMLPPRPILQKGIGELYLLTLVDERWWWWQTGDQFVPSSPPSWTQLLTDLFGSLGVTPTIDTIPSAYGIPTSSRWDVGFKPIPFVIDCVCRTIGMRVVRQLDGSVAVQTYATASALDDANWLLYRNTFLAGGQLAIPDIALSVPESVATVFLGDTNVAVDTTLLSLSLSDYGDSPGAPDWVGQIIADLPSSESTTRQDNYATQASTDYYLWALARTDGTMRGIQGRTLSGLDDFQEWVHAPDQVVTRVSRAVFSDRNIYGGLPTASSGAGSGSGVTTAASCDSACGTLLKLKETDCLSGTVVCATGDFSSLDTNQLRNVSFRPSAGTWVASSWDNGSSSWQPIDFDWAGGTGTLAFSWNATAQKPQLLLGGNPLMLLCFGADATFGGGPLNGFNGVTGASPVASCSNSDFIIKVQCACCANDKWGGPGIYCIVNANETCGVDIAACVYLSENAMCDSDIQICSGPYDTLAECEAVCNTSGSGAGSGGSVTVLCTDVGPTITCIITVTSGSGTCATTLNGLTTTATLQPRSIGDPYVWSGTFNEGDFDLPFTVTCDGSGNWTFNGTLIASCTFSASSAGPMDIISSSHMQVSGECCGSLCYYCDNTNVSVRIDFYL